MPGEKISQRNVTIGLLFAAITAVFFLYQFMGMEMLTERVKSRLCLNADWQSFDVDHRSPEELMEYLNWSNRSSCKLAHDFGGKLKRNPSGFDGQKAVCLLPASVAPPPRNCVVYSFGINNEWSFDDSMAAYGCQVFSFDPSMKAEDHDRGKSIHFFKIGISSENSSNKKGWKLQTLDSIYEMLQPRHGPAVIDYLKMDIEYDEWAALPQILESGILDRVRQMAVEVHLPLDDSLSKLRERVKILKRIEDYGMIRFDSKLNPWYSGNFKLLSHLKLPRGYEIAWYNKKFLTLN